MLRAPEDDAGFTLIELLISITILGILMAAVSAAMMVGLGTNASTGTRLDESRDEQFIAAYFSADVQGASTIKQGGAVVPACKFAGGGGTFLVEFVGEDASDADPPSSDSRVVTYWMRPAPAGGAGELHRLVCIAGAANPGAGGDTTLARNLNLADFAVSCTFSPPPAVCIGVDLTLRSGDLRYTVTGYKRTT